MRMAMAMKELRMSISATPLLFASLSTYFCYFAVFFLSLFLSSFIECSLISMLFDGCQILHRKLLAG